MSKKGGTLLLAFHFLQLRFSSLVKCSLINVGYDTANCYVAMDGLYVKAKFKSDQG